MKKFSFQVCGRRKKITKRRTIKDYSDLLEDYKRQKRMVEKMYLDDKIAREKERKKSILKRTKKGTITEVRSSKRVRFDDSKNQIKYYHLHPEEQFDKQLQFRLICGLIRENNY